MATLIYSQGLPGGFLLDDSSNLELLEGVTDRLSWQQWLEFLQRQGFAGPTGRPVALTTFFLQAPAWPHDPAAFKVVNIAIHLINTILIYRIAQIVFSNSVFKEQKQQYALLLTILWACNPLHISTVLYVIQRMALLSSMFMLLGFCCYYQLRLAAEQHQLRRVICWLVITLICAALSIFSKENGILLPVLILAAEHTIFRARPCTKILIAFKCLSALCLAALLIYLANSALAPEWTNRSFNARERLMTEPRILLDYLYKILLPSPAALGLFYDNYPLSTSLFSPFATLPALIVVIGLVIAGIAFAPYYPLACFGILWFLGNHLLESTSLNLELYFEHRNYIALFGPLLIPIGLTYYLGRAGMKKIAKATFTMYLGLTLAITFHEARIWSNPLEQAYVWAKRKPDSMRAQEAAAVIIANNGHVLEAATLVWQSAQRHQDAGPWISLVRLHCMDQRVTIPDILTINQKLSAAPFSLAAGNTLEELMSFVVEGHCKHLDPAYVSNIATQLIKNKNFQRAFGYDYLYFIRARMKHLTNDINGAVADLDSARQVDPADPEYPIIQAYWRYKQGHYPAALDLLQQSDEVVRKLPSLRRDLYYSKMLALRQAINKGSSNEQKH
ncbi:glycosyltransferase family 39 protein [Chitiniphilus purpureus]|uniref:Glycosyltransferase family 39 protein n=1 Tax=Chitiniphilus purpureus TaxID=2981137 RepID=A0ABY6DMN2_9NEIS|nr:glycosyltransferase family 39 protein [Chitiniphilus sp. CD1]UXY15622.1 glycosyltransferase family 39 protein [Chitiniphilus sp. CD1]